MGHSWEAIYPPMVTLPTVDNWRPWTIERVVERFTGAPFRWWVSGGNALALHMGRRWRAHTDTDVGIVRTDAHLAHRWLRGHLMFVGAAGRLSSWDGRQLSAERSENNVWVVGADRASWCLDLTIGAGDRREWIYRRDTDVRRRWSKAVLVSHSGVPYLAPEIQLLFKSKSPRSKDDIDAREVVPHLDSGGRAFLAQHLPSDHPWRQLLE
jgi:hypothetical protein